MADPADFHARSSRLFPAGGSFPYSYLIESAPAGQGGTVLSLFDVTLRSAVSLLAAPLAGFLFDLLGPYWRYAIGLGGCLVAWFILQVMARPPSPATV